MGRRNNQAFGQACLQEQFDTALAAFFPRHAFGVSGSFFCALPPTRFMFMLRRFVQKLRNGVEVIPDRGRRCAPPIRQRDGTSPLPGPWLRRMAAAADHERSTRNLRFPPTLAFSTPFQPFCRPPPCRNPQLRAHDLPWPANLSAGAFLPCPYEKSAPSL